LVPTGYVDLDEVGVGIDPPPERDLPLTVTARR
jgi:hypothetical protein